MEGSSLAAGLCRYVSPSHTRAALLWRSQNMRIIRTVPSWRKSTEAFRRSLGGRKGIQLATSKQSSGGTPSGVSFSHCLHAIIQKDYAIGYLCLVMLSKGTTALWATLEVLAHLQHKHQQEAAQPHNPEGSSSGPILAKAMSQLSMPQRFIDELGASVVVPSVDELKDILRLRPLNPEPGMPQPVSMNEAEPDQSKGAPQIEYFTGPSPQPYAAGHRTATGTDDCSSKGSKRVSVATEILGIVYPDVGGSGGGANNSSGGNINGGSGGEGGGTGGGGTGDGEGECPDGPLPQRSTLHSDIWIAVAISLALLIPPGALMALLLTLSRPLLEPKSLKRPARPRLARRITPRKRRFVLLQHAATHVLYGGESFLLLSPHSVGATLLFPAGGSPSKAAAYGTDAEAVPRAVLTTAADVPCLPLSAQLASLSGALTEAYERETRLAARLITRRAVAYVLGSEKFDKLTAALDASSTALSLSKRRMEDLTRSLEALQQDFERDVTLLCTQLEGLSEYREHILTELAARNAEMVEVVAARDGLVALLAEAQTEGKNLRSQLAKLRSRLDEVDAGARLAAQERDQARRRADDLTAQLKAAARFAATALQDTMLAMPGLPLPLLAGGDDTDVYPDVGTTADAAINAAEFRFASFSPSLALSSLSVSHVGSPCHDPVKEEFDVEIDEVDGSSFSSGSVGGVLPSPLRAVLCSAQQRAAELRSLKLELAALQEQATTLAASRAADAYSLVTAQHEAVDLRTDVSQLREELASAVVARGLLEEDVVSMQAMLGELHDRLRDSVEQLAVARHAQADAESQLAASQEDNATLDQQLQVTNRELVAARMQLLHAQHHVAEALVEKGTLRQQLLEARRQLAVAEAEVEVRGDRCRAAEAASAALKERLVEMQAELGVLVAKLQRAQADAGSALAAKAGLEVYVAELARVQEQAAATVAAASEELRAEIEELQARLNEAQAGRWLAERQASELQERVHHLEARLVEAEVLAAFAANVQAQQVVELRGELGTVSVALHDAQAAACNAEAMQGVAVRAATATVTDLQAAVGKLRQSLAAVEQELQHHRTEAAVSAATNAAHTAEVLHELHQRDAAAVALSASLTMVQSQLCALRADVDSKSVLHAEFIPQLQDLQCALNVMEAADKEATGTHNTRLHELAQQCEAACRTVTDLQAQLEATEAARGEFHVAALPAETEQQRLPEKAAVADEGEGKLEQVLRDAGEIRVSLEAQVVAGESALSELQARLHGAGEVLSETLSQLANANSAVRLLHQRSAGGMLVGGAEWRTPGSTCSSAANFAGKDDLANASVEHLRSQLAKRVQELQNSMDDLNSATMKALSLRAANEDVHRDLQERAEAAQAERNRLLEEVVKAQSGQQQLQEALDAVMKARRDLEGDLACSDAGREEFTQRLREVQAAHTEVVAQLSFSNSALRLLQQHLQSADAERLDLQARLGLMAEERFELRTQLTAQLQEVHGAMDMAEAQAEAATAALAAHTDELESCDTHGGKIQQLRAQLVASDTARRELLNQAVEAERKRQVAEAQVMAAEAAQQALAMQAAEMAEAAQQALFAALSCADGERHALRVQVVEGDTAQEELWKQLQSSEAARADALERVEAAHTALSAQQLNLHGVEQERLALLSELVASTDERHKLQARLSELLLELQGQAQSVEATAVRSDVLRAAEVTELLRCCEEGASYAAELQLHLQDSEAERQELLRRLAEATAEQESLLAQLLNSAVVQQQLEDRAAVAEAEARGLVSQLEVSGAASDELQERVAAGEAAHVELRARLDAMEGAHAKAQAQLADAGLTLCTLQRMLDVADGERRELQAQLTATVVEAHRVQSQLAERVTELQAAMQNMEAAAGDAEALQAAQRTALERRCEEGSRVAAELANGLSASLEVQQALVERLAEADARQQELADELNASAEARIALEGQVAAALSARGEMQGQLVTAEGARGEAMVCLAGANDAMVALQRRMTAVDQEREELHRRFTDSLMAYEGLQRWLSATIAAREHDGKRLEEVEAERDGLYARVAAAESALADVGARLEEANATHLMETEALRFAAGAAEAKAAVQAAAAAMASATSGELRCMLQKQLAEAEAMRGDLLARLAAADASHVELWSQLSASAAALTDLQHQLEAWESACDATQGQLARTDSIAHELVTQLDDSEVQRLNLQQRLFAAGWERQKLQEALVTAGKDVAELQERLTAAETMNVELQSQLEDCQQERDGLAVKLTQVEASCSVLTAQVHRFRTQLTAATDSAVIRRMTNATAIQEQYESLREESARERQVAQAQQEQMLEEIASLKAAADESTVRATVRVALARACLRAAEDGRRQQHDNIQPVLQLRAPVRMSMDMSSLHSPSPPPSPPLPRISSPNALPWLERGTDDYPYSTSLMRTGMDGFITTSAAAVVTDIAATVAPSEHGRRSSVRVESLGGFLQQGTERTLEGVDASAAAFTPNDAATAPARVSGSGWRCSGDTISGGGRTSVADYRQQLEHVRQRLEELRPQTARSLAAVDAALEVPSSFADMVQLAVASASPLGGITGDRANTTWQSCDPLNDSFSMVPDLGSLGTMLDANFSSHSQHNTSSRNANGLARGSGRDVPSPGAPHVYPPRQERATQVLRVPPPVPFSTPVTEYRQLNMAHGSCSGSKSSVFMSPARKASPLPAAPISLGEQLAVLKGELHKVEETGRQLEARLVAASQSPSTSLLETVTAQFQQAQRSLHFQDAIIRRSLDQAPSVSLPRGDGHNPSMVTAAPMDPHEDTRSCPDPLLYLDCDMAATPPDVQAVAASLVALRNGLQDIIEQQRAQLSPLPSPPLSQRPAFHSPASAAVSLNKLLAHVQVLEDYLLGNNGLLSALPTPTGMLLLPLSRSPVPAAARYAAQAAARGAGVSCARPNGDNDTAVGGVGSGRYTDGGMSTPLELPSPKTDASSGPASTPSDSPLLMATDSPAPLLASASNKHRQHLYPQQQQEHRQHHQHLQMDQGFDQGVHDQRRFPPQNQHQHALVTGQSLPPTQPPHHHHHQKGPRRQDLIAADGIVARPFHRSSAVHAAVAAVTAAAAAATSASVAMALLENKASDERPRSYEDPALGPRVASMQGITYDDSSLSVVSPSLTSLPQAQGLATSWEREAADRAAIPVTTGGGGRPLIIRRRRTALSGSAGGATNNSASVERRRVTVDDYGGLYDEPYGQHEWRSSEESPSPHSINEATVLTATPLRLRSSAQPTEAQGLPEPYQSVRQHLPTTALSRDPPDCQQQQQHQHKHRRLYTVSISSAAASLAAAAAAALPTPAAVRRQRIAAAGSGGGGGGGGHSFVAEASVVLSHASSPCTPVSDDNVCLATPLLFTVNGVMMMPALAAAVATPCLTPQPLDTFAAEQLLRYTNPCFMRTPSAGELAASENIHSQLERYPNENHLQEHQQNLRTHYQHLHQQEQEIERTQSVGFGRQAHGVGRRGYEGAAPMAVFADGLPTLEVSESVDVTELRTAQRRAAGLSAVSIEEAPLTSLVRVVVRTVGRSMPLLETPPPRVSSDEEDTMPASLPGALEPLLDTTIVTTRYGCTVGQPPMPAPQQRQQQQLSSAGPRVSTREVPPTSTRSHAMEESAGPYASYKADPHATSLLCLPTGSRSRRFSFRLPSRQGSRSSNAQPSNNDGNSHSVSHASAQADDTTSIASSSYQQYTYPYTYRAPRLGSYTSAQAQPPAASSAREAQRSSVDLIASHAGGPTAVGAGGGGGPTAGIGAPLSQPPLPPLVAGAKRKKGSFLGKIKRAVNEVVRRSSSGGAGGHTFAAEGPSRPNVSASGAPPASSGGWEGVPSSGGAGGSLGARASTGGSGGRQPSRGFVRGSFSAFLTPRPSS